MLQILPPEVARHLASAPVITGVASATKELVENALDAEATHISVFLGGYGLDFIEVSDDGCGISKQDLELIARPHTTSKLRQLSELEGVESYGFRGEALAALALVSCLQVISRPREASTQQPQSIAYRATYRAGERYGELEPEARTGGTTVRIMGLFEPLPVRRREAESQKKKELQRAIHVLQTYALAAPTVRFHVSWTTKGRENATLCLATQGSCSLRECLGILYGAEQLAWLMNVDLNIQWPVAALPDRASNPVRIKGYLSRCQSRAGRPSGDRQVLLLQGCRPVQWSRMRRMLDSEFRRLTNSTLHPVFVLAIELPPSGFDRNASPDKAEVIIHDDIALVNSVREALLAHWTLTATATSSAVISGTKAARELGGNRRAAAAASDLRKGQAAVRDESSGGASLTIETVRCWNEGGNVNRTANSNSGPSARSMQQPSSASGDTTGLCANSWIQSRPPESSIQPLFHFSAAKGIVASGEKILLHQDQEAQKLSSRTTWSNTKGFSFDAPPSSESVHGCEARASAIPTSEVYLAATGRCLDIRMTIDISEARFLKSPGASGVNRVQNIVSAGSPLEYAHIGEHLQLAFVLESSTRSTIESIEQQQQDVSPVDAERELEQCFHKDWFREMEVIGQFNRGFLLTKYGSDVFIIDQHAADEKYIYEQQAGSLRPRKQQLLQAVVVPASASDELILWEHRAQLAALGFELEFRWHEQPTQRVWMHSVPAVYRSLLSTTDLLEIAHRAPFTGRNNELLQASQIKLLLASRACRRAVMIGMPLDQQHMKSIVTHLADLEQPWNCPHGRPVMRHLLRCSDLYRLGASNLEP
jgi:DNA mismatch repair protein PMS2